MATFRVGSSVIMEVRERTIDITTGLVFRQTRTLFLSDIVSVTLSGRPRRMLELHLADGSGTRYRFGSAREAERARAAIGESLPG